MKLWYQSRTVWLNLLVLISAIIDMLMTSGQIPSGVVAVLSLVNLVLRFITKETVTLK